MDFQNEMSKLRAENDSLSNAEDRQKWNYSYFIEQLELTIKKDLLNYSQNKCTLNTANIKLLYTFSGELIRDFFTGKERTEWHWGIFKATEIIRESTMTLQGISFFDTLMKRLQTDGIELKCVYYEPLQFPRITNHGIWKPNDNNCEWDSHAPIEIEVYDRFEINDLNPQTDKYEGPLPFGIVIEYKFI